MEDIKDPDFESDSEEEQNDKKRYRRIVATIFVPDCDCVTYNGPQCVKHCLQSVLGMGDPDLLRIMRYHIGNCEQTKTFRCHIQFYGISNAHTGYNITSWVRRLESHIPNCGI